MLLYDAYTVTVCSHIILLYTCFVACLLFCIYLGLFFFFLFSDLTFLDEIGRQINASVRDPRVRTTKHGMFHTSKCSMYPYFLLFTYLHTMFEHDFARIFTSCF